LKRKPHAKPDHTSKDRATEEKKITSEIKNNFYVSTHPPTHPQKKHKGFSHRGLLGTVPARVGYRLI
jgi:hypothetical protein